MQIHESIEHTKDIIVHNTVQRNTTQHTITLSCTLYNSSDLNYFKYFNDAYVISFLS